MNKKNKKSPVLPGLVGEAFYKLYFENSEEAVFALTLDGEVLTANGAAEKALDYPAAGFAGIQWQDLFVDSQQWEQFAAELNGGATITRQLVFLKKYAGGTCHGLISLQSVFDESKKPLLMVATLSQKTRSDNLLQKERNLISAILDTTGALVALLDARYRFIRVSNAFERLTGCTIIDLLGNFFWAMALPENEVAGFKDAFKKLGAQRTPLEHRSRIVSNSGREHVIDWTLSVAVGENLQPEYVICSGIDVTKLQEALAQIKTLPDLPAGGS